MSLAIARRDSLDLTRSDHALIFSRKTLSEYKEQADQKTVSTKVKGVDKFYINDRLEIFIAPPSDIAIHDSKGFYTGGVVHEHLHAVMFPHVSRYKSFAAVAYRYISSRGLEYNPKLLKVIDNIVSDVVNDVEAIMAGGQHHRSIAVTRLNYFVKNKRDYDDVEKNRDTFEASQPANALIYTHYLYTAGIARGRDPGLGNDYISEEIYSWILRGAGEAIDRIPGYIVRGYPAREIYESAYRDGSEAADRIYRALIRSGGRWSGEIENLPELSAEEKFLAVTLALYAFHVKRGSEPSKHLVSVDADHEEVSEEDAKRYSGYSPGHGYGRKGIRISAPTLPPEAVEEAASKILREAIGVPRPALGIGSLNAKLPFLSYPSAPPDPSTIAKEPEEWTVRARIPAVEMKRGAGFGSPSVVTIVIDGSGSTANESSLLERYIGAKSTVFDAERTIAAAMIKKMLEKGWNPQVNIVVFDSAAWNVTLPASEAYKAIRDLHPNVVPRFAGTNVFDAIRVLREIHRDGRLNCIVFMSDMLISDEEAEALKEIINRRYRNSPALIISISEDLPKEIETINRYRNAAAASVKTAEDMRKVEEAIKKISGSL